MNTVKCSNRLCEKEYNVQFDNCPFCGTANPKEKTEKKTLIEKEKSSEDKKNDNNKSQFNGIVIAIIWINIIFFGIRGIMTSYANMVFAPAFGCLTLGLSIIGIVTLIYILHAKEWALFLWMAYRLTVGIVNGYISTKFDFGTNIIIAIANIGLMVLVLQIKKDGVSAWSVIFNKKKDDATNNDVNALQVAEEHIENEITDVKNGNNSDTIEDEEESAVETLDNKDVAPIVDFYSPADKETTQIEEISANTQKETASDEMDNTQAKVQNGRNKNKHTGIKIGKWWIYPLIIIATLAIVWLVVWLSHRPSELEFDQYVYVDAYDILHVDRNCKKIATIHGSTPISVYPLEDVYATTWKHLCASCVDERYYNTIIQKNNLLSFSKKPCKRDELYCNLIKSGKVAEAEIGTLEQFKAFVNDETSTRILYSNLLKSGLFSISELGSEDEFYEAIRSDFEQHSSSYSNEKIRVLYDRLLFTSKIYNIDFGIDKYTFDQFCKKYGTKKGLSELFDKLSDISNETEIDFQNREWLYEIMCAEGVNTGSFEEFKHSLSDKEDLIWYYDKCQEFGLNVGSYKDFVNHYAL